MEGAQRTYLVTGACGGLGAVVTGRLAAGGALVFAADLEGRHPAGPAGGPRVRPLVMDVTDRQSVEAGCGEIRQAVTGLDGIVCAAGLYVGGPLLDAPEAQIRRAFEVNVMGAALVTRSLFPLLHRDSRLVFISSESTRAALPFTGPYVMSKRALEAYADTLRRELLPLGIRVSVVQPGAIRTPLLRSAALSLESTSARPVYRAALEKAGRVLQKEMRSGMDAARVAQVILHALKSPRPRLRYRVGNNLPRAALSRLPSAWVDALVRKFL